MSDLKRKAEDECESDVKKPALDEIEVKKAALKEDKEEQLTNGDKTNGNGVEKENGAEEKKENGAEETKEAEAKAEDSEKKDAVAETKANGDTKTPTPEPEENDEGVLMFCGDINFEATGTDKQKNKDNQILVCSPHKLSTFSNIRVKFVASGVCSAHNVIITDTGVTWTWGKNDCGQLGLGHTDKRIPPQLVPDLQNFKAISAATGKKHTLVLTESGSCFAFGANQFGQCGVGNTHAVIHTPGKIKQADLKLIDVSCGGDFSMVVDDAGGLHSFGHPEHGQLGHNTENKYIDGRKDCFHYEESPTRIRVFIEKYKDQAPTPVGNVHITSVTCGMNHTVAIDSRKRGYSWGFGGYGRLGHDSPKEEMVPRLLKIFDRPGMGIVRVGCGRMHNIGVTERGAVYYWGQLKVNQDCTAYPKPVQDLHGWSIRSVSCGTSNVMVAGDESLVAWGCAPLFGELGTGDLMKTSPKPTEVKKMIGTYVKQVTSGVHHTLFVVGDDTEEDKKKLEKMPTHTLK